MFLAIGVRTELRDIFTDLFANERPDPVEAARRAMRAPLPRRFYQQAGVDEAEGGFRVVLDGRPVRTPARRFLIAPSRRLGEAIAAEWDTQGETIDPATMPLTRLANSIIDGVAAAPEPVAADVEKYLGSDLLLYRAEGPQRLVERQGHLWDPVLAWAREALGARFVLAQGVVHAAQPEGAIAAARAAIPDDPWRLGAAGARAVAGASHGRRGLDGGPGRRGLEHGAVGPRRDRLGTARRTPG